MLLSDRVVKDHSCGMITYVGEWNEDIPPFMRDQVGRSALTNL